MTGGRYFTHLQLIQDLLTPLSTPATHTGCYRSSQATTVLIIA
jgi:hypothetical protein